MRDELADRDVAQRPPWTRKLLGARPEQYKRAEYWDRAVREVARYRIEQPVDPDTPGLGPEPAGGPVRGQWRQARLEEGGLLDLADRALIEAEAVRHVVRDLLDEQPPVDLRDEGAAIRMLEEWLPGITVGQLSELAGISVRQLQRRRRDGGGMTSPRLQLVARIAAILRHGWTDRGVVAWFTKPHPALDGKSPMELLDDPERERDLLILARAGRVQGAS